MFGPFIVPGYGDMTADIAAELAKMANEEHERDLKLAAARTAHMVAMSGKETRMLDCGQQVAQVELSVYQYWEKRDPNFWKKGSGGREWFFKKHPECLTRARADKTTLLVDGFGRPAAPVSPSPPAASLAPQLSAA